MRALLGDQQPRLLHVPEYVSTTGREAIELAAIAGLDLDPWQQLVLIHSLGERPDGKWSAFEVGVEVPRQNGKGGLLEARGLAGLFLLGERLIIHSAHEFATAIKALDRMAALIENTPSLSKRLRARGGVVRSHGFEAIRLKTGQALEYRTRTKGGGRGFSCECLILDEAMHIPEAMHGALMPTLSAQGNPQIWYTGSAVDQQSMDHGLVFARVRERAMKGDDQALAYFGWSPPFDNPGAITAEAMADPAVWAQANPALGIRISAEHIAREQRSMAPRTFAVERLGVGDWPSAVGARRVISAEAWAAGVDERSAMQDPVCLAFDVTPDRSRASICAAGWRSDGKRHVEVVDHRPGTGWVVERVAELVRSQSPSAVLSDANGPGASLVKACEEADLEVEWVAAKEHTQACGTFYDAVDQDRLRHLGSSELTLAVGGAVKRQLGDAWAWSRKSSAVDISPLVASTLALWGTERHGGSVYEERGLLVLDLT